MKYLDLIWKFLNSRIFVIILIVILIIFIAGTCKRKRDLRIELFRTEQNLAALHDSLKFERLKNNQLIVSISGYIATEKELKTLNKSLYDRVRAQKGEILSLNRSIVQLVQDTIMLRKNIDHLNTKIGKMFQLNDSVYIAPWALSYKYDEYNFDMFSGKTIIGLISKDPLTFHHINTEMTSRLSQIDLTWGQKIEDGKLRVYIQSAYPGFTVKSMEGVLIDPQKNPFIKEITKKKHWFQGLSIGFGITPGWDFLNNRGAIVVGPTLSYSIYTW
jgi:hypothetical protein